MAICQLCIPNKIRLGVGVLDSLAGDIQETKAKKILLVTGTNVAKSIIFETIKNKLAHVNATVEVFSQTEPEPSLASLNSAATKLKSGKYDLIIGLGGGSNIDMA
ncbi:MAG: iron-containing alcohol dehydrogenase, partial [Chloroflexi bacterium]|nr:iron-containing alcohol dehydrogenase [Chloroflexota bacterium]